MTNTPQLLAAIHGALGDDAPRRVYADWLLDRGEPRGELIHLQCEIADELDPERRQMLEERASALLDAKNQLLWKEADGVPRRAASSFFLRRGFVETYTLSRNKTWLTDIEQALRTIPTLCELRVYDIVGRDLLELLTLDLKRITRLSLNGCRIGLKGMQALASTKAMPSLTSLELAGGEHTPKAIDILAGAANLAGLKRLSISKNRLPDAALDSLRQSPHLRQLTMVELGENAFTAEAVSRWLASSETPLVELRLSHTSLGNQGAVAIANSPRLASTTLLHLNGCGINAQGGLALARSPYFSPFRSFTVTNNPIGAKATAALVQAGFWSKLKTVDLMSCAIGDEGAEAVATSPHLTKIERLNLANNGIGDKGAFALAKATHWTDLQRVRLNNNRIGDAAARAIAAAPQFLKPTVLFLTHNGFGPDTEKFVKGRGRRPGAPEQPNEE